MQGANTPPLLGTVIDTSSDDLVSSATSIPINRQAYNGVIIDEATSASPGRYPWRSSPPRRVASGITRMNTVSSADLVHEVLEAGPVVRQRIDSH
jgi:hypothetical protein